MDYVWMGPTLGGLHAEQLQQHLITLRTQGPLQTVLHLASPPPTAAEHSSDTLEQRVYAIMCSEGYWQQCHRAVIADALTANRVQVRGGGTDVRYQTAFQGQNHTNTRCT